MPQGPATIQTPNCSGCSESLYLLSYPSPNQYKRFFFKLISLGYFGHATNY